MKAYFIGGGIGSLAGAAFLIRDAQQAGRDIVIYEAQPLVGGSLDGALLANGAYSLRGGRMLTTDHYECTWDLLSSIPSLEHPGLSVRDETIAFNVENPAHSQARLVDRNRFKVDVSHMGFSARDRLELLRLTEASEEALGNSRITDWLSPKFFESNFWYMWQTTFAFQPWHSVVELKRYLHRFMSEFPRIETLAGVKRTVYNQYDAIVRPLADWLKRQGVQFVRGTEVTDMAIENEDGRLRVRQLVLDRDGRIANVRLEDGDLVFFQNGSMTDASSLGTMTEPPPHLTKKDSQGWALWETIAQGRPEFGNPAAFNSSIPESYWLSFTVTCRDPRFFDRMEAFSGNTAGTGGLVTFKDSNWLMSVVLYHQPHFAGQPKNVQVFLGLCAASRSRRQFRRQADVRMRRRGDPEGAVWPSEFRWRRVRGRDLHSLPHALHHQHVHAAQSGRPAAAGAEEFGQPRFRQPVRRNPRRRRVHGRIFGARGADGGLSADEDRSPGAAGDAARQVARGDLRDAGESVRVTAT